MGGLHVIAKRTRSFEPVYDATRCLTPLVARGESEMWWRSAELDQHLAEVLALEEAEEGVRRLLDALDDGLAPLDLALRDPAATGRSGTPASCRT